MKLKEHGLGRQWNRLAIHGYTQGQMAVSDAVLISTIKARTDKIRSNLHAGQYASNVSSWPGQGQSLVENLHAGQYASNVSSWPGQGQSLVESLALPEVTRHINKFLCETTLNGSGYGTTHGSSYFKTYSTGPLPMMRFEWSGQFVIQVVSPR